MKSARKRILFVVPSLRGGGAERVMVTLIRHLDRARFEPHLALVKAEGPYLSDVPSDVPVHDLKAGRARYALPSIVRLCWRLRPNLLLSTLGYLNLTLIFARRLLPPRMCLLVREVTSVSAQSVHDVSYPKVWDWLYRRLYKKADAIICASDYMRNDLAENFGIPLEKMVRIYNPVDIERIRQLAASMPNPYLGDGPHVVTAGRLSREKGIDILLEAMVFVRQAYPSVRLTILGKGPLEADLREQSKQLGLAEAVHFRGFQSNPYPYYKHADMFVLSSHYEGMPNGVLEALALGTIVVGANIPSGVGEIAERTEELKLVADATPRAFADGMIAVLGENKARRPAVADPPFWKTFGVQNVVSEYEALFSKVIDGIPA